MKAPELHKLMKRHFLPFVFEHGFVACGLKGQANALIGQVNITFGYAITAGYYNWTGGEMELIGNARFENRQLQQLMPHFHPRESVMPPTLRQLLRSLGREKLDFICAHAQDEDETAPYFLALRQRYDEMLALMHKEPLFVPSSFYFEPEDVVKWCRAVVPHIPEAIKCLTRAARNASEAPRIQTEGIDWL